MPDIRFEPEETFTETTHNNQWLLNWDPDEEIKGVEELDPEEETILLEQQQVQETLFYQQHPEIIPPWIYWNMLNSNLDYDKDMF
jgi:hypothetical protein